MSQNHVVNLFFSAAAENLVHFPIDFNSYEFYWRLIKGRSFIFAGWSEAHDANDNWNKLTIYLRVNCRRFQYFDGVLVPLEDR